MGFDADRVDELIHRHLLDRQGAAPRYHDDDGLCGDIVLALRGRGALVEEGVTALGFYYLDVSGGRVVATRPVGRRKAMTYAVAAVTALGLIQQCVTNG
jgi:hypothetical protein